MSEENNKSNYDLSREEINEELDKLINEKLDKSTEDEILPDDTSKILCYSMDFPIEVVEEFERLMKSIRKNDDDDNCPSSPSNDNHNDESNTPKEE